MDRHTDDQHDIITPCHYPVVGYKKCIIWSYDIQSTKSGTALSISLYHMTYTEILYQGLLL